MGDAVIGVKLSTSIAFYLINKLILDFSEGGNFHHSVFSPYKDPKKIFSLLPTKFGFSKTMLFDKQKTLTDNVLGLLA
jgi:hypothetical protein